MNMALRCQKGLMRNFSHEAITPLNSVISFLGQAKQLVDQPIGNTNIALLGGEFSELMADLKTNISEAIRASQKQRFYV